MTFQQHLSRLRALVLTQRAARLILRAVWLGLAGYLVGWGIFTIWGVLDSTVYWWALAFLLAEGPLIAIFIPPKTRRIAWRADRFFGFREQVITAYQGADDPPNALSKLLSQDAARLVERLFGRVLRRGWDLLSDLESLMIVGTLLFAILLFADLENIPDVSVSPGSGAANLPGVAEAPTYDEVFPSGIPGLRGETGEDGQPIPGGGESERLTPEEAGILDNILSNLGEALSDNPETSEIGEALQDGDLQAAAAAIERTGDNVDLMPQETREETADAFEQAAQQAQEAGQDDLAEDLQAAAEALRNPDPGSPMVADSLDELAEEFREMGEKFAAMGVDPDAEELAPPGNAPQVGSADGASGAGSGSGTEGEPEPLTRLEGEGQDLEFEGGDEPSGLLTPGSSTNDPASVGDTPSVTSSGSENTGEVDSILTPYHYSWRWRDVVSQYFSPED